MTQKLIIEPEANLRALLREALEQEGYDAAEATNSAKGSRLLTWRSRRASC